MGKIEKSSKQQILDEHLYGNINISVRNTPIFYSEFSRCNIKIVRDIWNIQNNDFHDEQYIQNNTAPIHNWRQKYNKLKRNIPERWVNILRSNDNQIHVKPLLEINNELLLHMNNKIIETNKLSFKLIKNHLLNDALVPKCQSKWEAIYNQNFNWKLIWDSINRTLCSNREKQFQWKLVHNAIFTEHKLQLMNLSNGLCHFCKRDTEDIKHLFYTCPITYAVVRHIQEKVNTVLNANDSQILDLNSHHVILGYVDGDELKRNFVNSCLILLKWELWKIRNNIKFENRRYTINDISGFIMQKLKDATNFIARTKVSRTNEKVINLLKQLEQTQNMF